MRGQTSEPHSPDMAQGHVHLQGWPLVWKRPETDRRSFRGAASFAVRPSLSPCPFMAGEALNSACTELLVLSVRHLTQSSPLVPHNHLVKEMVLVPFYRLRHRDSEL